MVEIQDKAEKNPAQKRSQSNHPQWPKPHPIEPILSDIETVFALPWCFCCSLADSALRAKETTISTYQFNIFLLISSLSADLTSFLSYCAGQSQMNKHVNLMRNFHINKLKISGQQ